MSSVRTVFLGTKRNWALKMYKCIYARSGNREGGPKLLAVRLHTSAPTLPVKS